MFKSMKMTERNQQVFSSIRYLIDLYKPDCSFIVTVYSRAVQFDQMPLYILLSCKTIFIKTYLKNVYFYLFLTQAKIKSKSFKRLQISDNWFMFWPVDSFIYKNKQLISCWIINRTQMGFASRLYTSQI